MIFHLHYSDRFSLTKDVELDFAEIVTCAITETFLEKKDLGYVEFSGAAKARGCNPCLVDCSGAVNVTPTSWSRIKTLVD